MSGHLTIEAFDENGDLKAMRTSDNIITQQAENCALRALFSSGANLASNSGTGVCVGALNTPWTFIAVGTGTTQEDGAQLALATESTTDGLQRAGATTVTWSNSTGSEADIDGTITLAKTFSVTGSHTIQEAGLFNDTYSASGNTDSMFARKTFDAVSVANGDSLTVTWTINVGNSTSLN